MSDKNNAGTKGFFFSQADIDEINKQNNAESGDRDWFTGVQTMDEGGLGTPELAAWDISSRIITEDIGLDSDDAASNGRKTKAEADQARAMAEALRKAAEEAEKEPEPEPVADVNEVEVDEPVEAQDDGPVDVALDTAPSEASVSPAATESYDIADTNEIDIDSDKENKSIEVSEVSEVKAEPVIETATSESEIESIELDEVDEAVEVRDDAPVDVVVNTDKEIESIDVSGISEEKSGSDIETAVSETEIKSINQDEAEPFAEPESVEKEAAVAEIISNEVNDPIETLVEAPDDALDDVVVDTNTNEESVPSAATESSDINELEIDSDKDNKPLEVPELSGVSKIKAESDIEAAASEAEIESIRQDEPVAEITSNEVDESIETSDESDKSVAAPETVPAKTIVYDRAAIEAELGRSLRSYDDVASDRSGTYTAQSDPKPYPAQAQNAEIRPVVEPPYVETPEKAAKAAVAESGRAKRAEEEERRKADQAAKEEKRRADQAAKEEKRRADQAAKEEKRKAGRAARAEKAGRAERIRADKAARKKAERAERKRVRMTYKGEGPGRRLLAVAAGILLVAIAVAAVYYWIQYMKPYTAYIAGNSSDVDVYVAADMQDDSAAASEEAASAAGSAGGASSDALSVETLTTDDGEQLAAAGSLIRGTEVRAYRESRTSDDVRFSRISYTDPETGDETDYFIDEDNLVREYKDVVQESEVWVRTPATIYEQEGSPTIASFAPKGTCLKVTGFDRLLDNGYINMYKVEYDPVETKEEDTAEGYVYGKYMSGTEEEAVAPYNEHGETDKAAEDRFGFELYGGHGENLDWYPYEKTAIEGNDFCKNARAMYINSYAAVHPNSWVKIIKKTDCNAVVIDIKDGPLAFEAETAKELSPTSYKNSYVSEEEYKEGIDKYRATGAYLIGRIVVFNDPYYAKDHPEDCIKYGSDRSWPSAYSRSVWEYNVRLAQEAVEKFGFNEIQFDYVRFPEASYDMSKSGKADFRNKYGEEKAQAVQNFVFYAADQLRESDVYISVDVFGESAYGYVTAYGQYWAAISNIVDAISAMPYTDHFSGEAPWEHPYESVLRWAKRAAQKQERIQDPAAARTWITGYNTPYWEPTVNYNTKRMKAQINALRKAGLKGGFIPWNAMSDISKYDQYRDIWNK